MRIKMHKLNYLKGKDVIITYSYDKKGKRINQKYYEEEDVNTAINKTVKELVDEIDKEIQRPSHIKEEKEYHKGLSKAKELIKSKFKQGE